MNELARQSSARRGAWLCGLCSRGAGFSHLKRHLAAHHRHGASRAATDEEWRAFLDVTGRPTNLARAGALVRRRPSPRRPNPGAPDA
jgi:hypothetical protein